MCGQGSAECQKVTRYVLLGLTVLGWIFSVVSVAHCSFIQIAGANVGLFNGGIEGGSCVRYPSGSDFSTGLTVARAFGVLLTLALSAAMILVAVAVLVYPNRVMWIVYRVLLGCSFAFNLFTFSAFSECADLREIQSFLDIYCSVGGASVCAILNSWLLLSISIISCVIPSPEEPVLKNVACCNNATNNNNDTPATTVKRTVEETPTGKKITEEVTDAAGVTTIKTTFEPNANSAQEIRDSFNVGPTVKTTVTDLPNGTKTVEEDAQGNKTITTRIVVMAAQDEEEAYDTVVAPEPVENTGNAIMAAAVIPEGNSRQSRQNNSYAHAEVDEERGMANPYFNNGSRQERRRQDQGYSSPYGQQARDLNESRTMQSPKTRNTRATMTHGSSPGPDFGLDKPGKPTPRDLEDSASSAFTGSANYDSSFMASSATFGESSGNFNASYAPGESSALDGVDGERKPRKKKKTKKHKHHRSEHHHSSSRHRKKETEAVEGTMPLEGNAIDQAGG